MSNKCHITITFVVIVGVNQNTFSEVRLNVAESKNIKIVSLGKRILRTEDAAPFLIPILLSYTDNL